MYGCRQHLAHLKSTLRWPYAKDIKDTPDILLAEEETTYDFIDKMVAAISRSLSSPRIHIGMEDAGELGMGAYLKKHGHVDRFDIMCSHLDFLPKTQWGYVPCLCGRKCDIACYKHLKGEL